MNLSFCQLWKCSIFFRDWTQVTLVVRQILNYILPLFLLLFLAFIFICWFTYFNSGWLELWAVFLPQLLEFWDSRSVVPCLAPSSNFILSHDFAKLPMLPSNLQISCLILYIFFPPTSDNNITLIEAAPCMWLLIVHFGKMMLDLRTFCKLSFWISVNYHELTNNLGNQEYPISPFIAVKRNREITVAESTT